METLQITRYEFEEFRRLQEKHRWDWPAVFSANAQGEIWPFVSFGHTPGQSRDDVRGLSLVVDRVAEEYLKTRDLGGRFFINAEGAFFKDATSQVIKFMVIQIRG